MYHSSAIYKATGKQRPYKRMKTCAYCHFLKRCKYRPTFLNTIRRLLWSLWRKASVKKILWICGCGWKERSNPNSWWHKTPRYRTVVHHEFLQVSKVWCLLFISAFVCGLFVCSLWWLKFAIQWRWAFELALVMERICCCNWVGSWMRNVDHLVKDWLVREIG